jgi:hypothetical protein
MQVITLLKNFTFAGDNGQSWATDWIAVPAGFQNWQLIVLVKSIIAGSNIGWTLQTTWDTDTVSSTGATGSITAVSTTPTNITSGVGPMVRILFAPTVSPSIAVLSIFLTPKSE